MHQEIFKVLIRQKRIDFLAVGLDLLDHEDFVGLLMLAQPRIEILVPALLFLRFEHGLAAHVANEGVEDIFDVEGVYDVKLLLYELDLLYLRDVWEHVEWYIVSS